MSKFGKAELNVKTGSPASPLTRIVREPPQHRKIKSIKEQMKGCQSLSAYPSKQAWAEEEEEKGPKNVIEKQIEEEPASSAPGAIDDATLDEWLRKTHVLPTVIAAGRIGQKLHASLQTASSPAEREAPFYAAEFPLADGHSALLRAALDQMNDAEPSQLNVTKFLISSKNDVIAMACYIPSDTRRMLDVNTYAPARVLSKSGNSMHKAPVFIMRVLGHLNSIMTLTHNYDSKHTIEAFPDEKDENDIFAWAEVGMPNSGNVDKDELVHQTLEYAKELFLKKELTELKNDNPFARRLSMRLTKQRTQSDFDSRIPR